MLLNRTRPIRQSGTIYFSAKEPYSYIIAYNNINQDGIFHEVYAERYIGTDHELVPTVFSLVRKSEHDKLDLRTYKKTDWKAYNASGLKSVKAFESEYSQISISGENEANILFDAHVTFGSPVQYSIHCVLNPNSSAASFEAILFLVQKTLEIRKTEADEK